MTLPIVSLSSIADMQDAADIQKAYWGSGEGNVIAAHMLYTIASTGGHVLAAMDGDVMAGVLVGLLGMKPSADGKTGEPYVFSKRMIVSSSYRNQKLGERLKLAQRDHALAQGIELVKWTFDPLLAPNAHLNIRKLGAISRSYRENVYGTDNVGGLSPDGTSDRLYVEWHLTDPKIDQLQSGDTSPSTLDQYLEGASSVFNLADHTGTLPSPKPSQPNGVTPKALVEIPLNYPKIQQEQPNLALEWRMHIRDVLGGAMEAGYTVFDFVRGEHEGATRGFYVLTKA